MPFVTDTEIKIREMMDTLGVEKAEEAFAKDPELSWYYADCVTKKPFPAGEEVIAKDAHWSYQYACYVLHKRFLAGEEAMSQDPHTAFHYANSFFCSDVIDGKIVYHNKRGWPKGEPVLLKSREWAPAYAVTVLRKRWPEAEETIAKDSFGAFTYALHIIKKRWPEGELAISKSSGWATAYAKWFNFQWPEGSLAEKTISNSPENSLRYATEVIKGAFPAGEFALATSPEGSLIYALLILKGRFPKGEKAMKSKAKVFYTYKKCLDEGIEHYPDILCCTASDWRDTLETGVWFGDSCVCPVCGDSFGDGGG